MNNIKNIKINRIISVDGFFFLNKCYILLNAILLYTIVGDILHLDCLIRMNYIGF